MSTYFALVHPPIHAAMEPAEGWEMLPNTQEEERWSGFALGLGWFPNPLQEPGVQGERIVVGKVILRAPRSLHFKVLQLSRPKDLATNESPFGIFDADPRRLKVQPPPISSDKIG